jgi:hypothetical protein
MSGHGEKLTRKQEQAIAAMLSEANVEQAAAKAGVSYATLRRRLSWPPAAAAAGSPPPSCARAGADYARPPGRRYVSGAFRLPRPDRPATIAP